MDIFGPGEGGHWISSSTLPLRSDGKVQIVPQIHARAAGRERDAEAGLRCDPSVLHRDLGVAAERGDIHIPEGLVRCGQHCPISRGLRTRSDKPPQSMNVPCGLTGIAPSYFLLHPPPGITHLAGMLTTHSMNHTHCLNRSW